MKSFVMIPAMFISLLTCDSTINSANSTSPDANTVTKNISDTTAKDDVATTSSANGNAISKESASKNTIAAGGTHFGVLVNKTDNVNMDPDAQLNVIKELGIKYVRTRLNMGKWSGRDAAMEKFNAAGLKVCLNVNWAAGTGLPVAFPTDMNVYGERLTSILNKYQPDLLNVENEEDNKMYHTGTASDYEKELNTAVKIAHAKGVKVTNGGITSLAVAALVFDDLVNSGKRQEANKFAHMVFPEARASNMERVKNNPAFADRLTEAKQLISIYKNSDIDYVAFHWYLPARGIKGAEIAQKVDPAAIDYIVAYLQKATGKPAITTEIGQLDPSPAIVKNTLQRCFDLKLPYVIWYSGDGGEGKAIALQNANGDLRENGKMFKEFIQSNNAGN